MSAAAEYLNQIILFVNFIWFCVFYDILEISHEMDKRNGHCPEYGWRGWASHHTQQAFIDQTQSSPVPSSPIWLGNIKIY